MPTTSGVNTPHDDRTWMQGVVGYQPQRPRYQCEVERQRMEQAEQAAHNSRGFRATFAALPGQQRIYDSGNYYWVPSSQIPRFQCEVERQRFLEAAYTIERRNIVVKPDVSSAAQQRCQQDESRRSWISASSGPESSRRSGTTKAGANWRQLIRGNRRVVFQRCFIDTTAVLEQQQQR